ncbi:MAG: hypothetical protein KDD64_04705 [Bdellovibrionales bacterium]|nr:hypothetical protein [Bdellovibrionales bacterium]
MSEESKKPLVCPSCRTGSHITKQYTIRFSFDRWHDSLLAMIPVWMGASALECSFGEGMLFGLLAGLPLLGQITSRSVCNNCELDFRARNKSSS